jgi:hypothetical protein
VCVCACVHVCVCVYACVCARVRECESGWVYQYIVHVLVTYNKPSLCIT